MLMPAQLIAVGRPSVASKTPRKAERPALLAALRACIAGIERKTTALKETRQPSAIWGLGENHIDERLPKAGLAVNAVHEITASRYSDTPAAMGFAACLAIRRFRMKTPRPLLWVRLDRGNTEWGKLYGHGLAALGLPRERLIIVTLRKPQALLWTVEEALRSRTLAAIIADGDRHAIDLNITRRLSLAAEEGATPLLLVFSHPVSGGTAALSRWEVKSLASSRPPFDEYAPGPPAWALTLQRCRLGRTGQWFAEWNHATHCFSLVTPLLRGKTESRLETGGLERPERSRPGLRAG